MGEKVARSIVGRLSPKPQVLSNLGVARLCSRGMLLGGEWTTQADVEIGFKRE
jgi:DNA-directed RNA polymerase subunit N (RpoN/RPB10)